MRFTDEEIKQQEEESKLVEKAEKDSNNIDLIEKEKIQYDALKSYSEKPKYSMPEESPTILERAKRWLQDVFSDKPSICKIHGVEYREHGFEGFWDCPECRIERYEVIKQMK